jgi:hypothetical protein
LPAGNQILRLYSLAGEYNLNWFDISKINAIPEIEAKNNFRLFPNPTNGELHILSPIPREEIKSLRLFNVHGTLMWEQESVLNPPVFWLPHHLISGLYVLEILTEEGLSRHKILKM